MLYKKTAVIGHPVEHSLSPNIHNHWIKNLALNIADYKKIDVHPNRFSDEIDNLIGQGYYGLNVTVPLKELAYKKADRLSDVSKATKAVNTLVFKNGQIFGTNTDPVGFESSLAKNIIEDRIKNKKCLVLGAGGSARAIIYALHKMSGKISVYNRTEEKAATLKKEMKINIEILSATEINKQLEEFSFIVNTTSAGLASGQQNDLVDFRNATKNCFVYDLIYKPKETGFMKQAQANGLTTQNGLNMLIGQAAASFYIWHGVSPEVSVDLIQTLASD